MEKPRRLRPRARPQCRGLMKVNLGDFQASILGTHTNARLSGAYPGRPPTFPALETRLTFNKVDLEKNPMEPRQQQFSLWYVLVTILAMLAIQTLFVSGHVETIPYSDFKVLLKAGKLKDVAIGEQAISGTFST